MKLSWMRVSFVAVALVAAFLFVGMPWTVWAQTAVPTPEPIPYQHTVQEGENITYIASLYGVTVEEILAINNLGVDALLFVGQQLIIPGQQGEVVATLYTVQVGDSLDQIAAMFNTTPADILQTNQLTNPYAPFLAGQQFNIISRTGTAVPQAVTGTPHIVAIGETWTTIAAQYNLLPHELAASNQLAYPSYLIPGQRLRIPTDETGYRFMTGEWLDVQLRPLPIIQGDTVTIYVENLLDGRPEGTFGNQTLRFFPYEDGFAALVGVDAFAEVGVYELALKGSGSQPWRPFSQSVPVQSGGYGLQPITVVPELEYLLAPEVRQSEDERLAEIYLDSAPEPLWDGIFQAPVTTTIVTGVYGDSRSYNEGPIITFHTGVDFGGEIGTPILAPANGVIKFVDTLELRGGTVIVDHGAGVMSAYFHLSQFFVSVGDEVVQGQPIAAGGSTGLSTGPHLHWDLRINNTAVNGASWLNTVYP